MMSLPSPSSPFTGNRFPNIFYGFVIGVWDFSPLKVGIGLPVKMACSIGKHGSPLHTNTSKLQLNYRATIIQNHQKSS